MTARAKDVASDAVPRMAVLRTAPANGPIFNHDELRTAITQVLRVHSGDPGENNAAPGLHVWTGEPGFGKSMAAEQFEVECNDAADAGKAGAFRAKYCVAIGDVYKGGMSLPRSGGHGDNGDHAAACQCCS